MVSYFKIMYLKISRVEYMYVRGPGKTDHKAAKIEI